MLLLIVIFTKNMRVFVSKLDKKIFFILTYYIYNAIMVFSNVKLNIRRLFLYVAYIFSTRNRTSITLCSMRVGFLRPTLLLKSGVDFMDKKSVKSLALRISKATHIVVSVALYCLCVWFFYKDLFNGSEQIIYTVAGGVIFFVLVLLIGRIYDVYSIGASRVSYLIYSCGLTFFMADVVSYVLVALVSFQLANPLPIIGLFLAHMAWSALWSWLGTWFYFKLNPPKKTVVVYGERKELYKLNEVKRLGKRFDIIKTVDTFEGHDAVSKEIADAEVVFLAGVENELRSAIVKECIVRGAQCYIMPRVGDIIMCGADLLNTFSVPFMCVNGAVPKLEYLLVKRAIDIVASLAGILVLSPFMLVTAIIIKLYDGGPVLYKQTRLTKGHKEFKVWKFRSMRVDAEKDGVARLSTEHDDRITPVGKIIRKIRFDELPQLFNILKGDMTIVGPRPERPEIASQYEKEIPSFGLRLQVKAGLTGYAQVYGRYNTEPYDKLKMDLIYINNMSLGEDIRLMFATVKILFLPESTEGIADGSVTAMQSDENVVTTDNEREYQKTTSETR